MWFCYPVSVVPTFPQCACLLMDFSNHKGDTKANGNRGWTSRKHQNYSGGPRTQLEPSTRLTTRRSHSNKNCTDVFIELPIDVWSMAATPPTAPAGHPQNVPSDTVDRRLHKERQNHDVQNKRNGELDHAASQATVSKIDGDHSLSRNGQQCSPTEL